MVYLVAIFAGLCVTMLVAGLYELATAPGRAVTREIEEIRKIKPVRLGIPASPTDPQAEAG